MFCILFFIADIIYNNVPNASWECFCLAYSVVICFYFYLHDDRRYILWLCSYLNVWDTTKGPVIRTHLHVPSSVKRIIFLIIFQLKDEFITGWNWSVIGFVIFYFPLWSSVEFIIFLPSFDSTEDISSWRILV